MPSTPEPHAPQTSQRTQLLVSVAVGVACAGVLLATSFPLPMVWDEGNAIWRAEGIRAWARTLFRGSPTTSHPLAPETLAHYWRYTTQIEGHPAFYGVVITLGRSLGDCWLPPLQAARLGPILLFSLATGAVFYRVWRCGSFRAAVLGALALVLLPRLFAHAHFASTDGPLTSCWMLAWALFPAARQSRVASAFFGVALGAAMACKATGWLAPVPFIVWTMVCRDRPGARVLLWSLLVAPAVFYVLNPPLWHNPVGGVARFFTLNLDRRQFNVSIQFLGRLYDLGHPLPWYNTVVWTAVTVPVGLLVLSLAGAAKACQSADRQRMLLVANAACLLVVRSLPFAPPHDGVRLFLPAFSFLAMLAGAGGDWLLELAARMPRSLAVRGGLWVLVIGSYVGAAGSLLWYAPQWLSYYSPCIGGLRGAAALGMEPTYYWDALDSSVLAWLRRNTGPNQKVAFAAGPSENLVLMERWGMLGFEFRDKAAGCYRWYVLQNRPGAWSWHDQQLRRQCRPVFQKVIRRGGWGPWRIDVPLIEVYHYADYAKVRAAAGDSASEPNQ